MVEPKFVFEWTEEWMGDEEMQIELWTYISYLDIVISPDVAAFIFMLKTCENDHNSELHSMW